MDTRSPLQPLIKSPELAEREEAARSQLFTLIPGRARCPAPAKTQGGKGRVGILAGFSGLGLPDHPGSAQADLPLGFKVSSKVPSCLLSP